MCGNQHINKLV
uniref:Uncharacterized protein n=1 Tax=Lepeophtheirus salmonis TaxID=72036 RepID=A0A0K2SV89_LEPSM